MVPSAVEAEPGGPETVGVLTEYCSWGCDPTSRDDEALASNSHAAANMSKIRVLIVDDHSVVREGLKALLASDPNIQTVGEAVDGNEAIGKAAETKPDVILMDVAMPGMNGRIATVKIRRSLPNVKILVLSSYRDEEMVREMVFAGAVGFLVKNACADDLLQAVHGAVRGESSFSPCVEEQFSSEKQRESMTMLFRKLGAGGFSGSGEGPPGKSVLSR
jgi:DNA-binding NarL/FixJ family response regulator